MLVRSRERAIRRLCRRRSARAGCFAETRPDRRRSGGRRRLEQVAPIPHAGCVDARAVNDPMLPLRFDVPIAFKPDANVW